MPNLLEFLLWVMSIVVTAIIVGIVGESFLGTRSSEIDVFLRLSTSFLVGSLLFLGLRKIAWRSLVKKNFTDSSEVRQLVES